MGKNRGGTEQPSANQQQSVVEEQQRPTYSAATAAWGGKIVVREELSEGRNNTDSGLSSDHYNSPNSGRSSTSNSFSLENLTTSRSANAMSRNNKNFEYCAPFCGCRNCSSLEECASHRETMDERQRNVPSTSGVSQVQESSSKNAEFAPNSVLKCAVCDFDTSNRIKLIEHLTDHCAKEAESSKSSQDGGNSDLVKVIEQMHSLRNDNWYHSVQGNYSKNTNEGTEDPSLRMPRVNSQGKVKTFRCKQCNFTAVTKLDFWEHSRTHIRAERLLTCPKCPFVTEYKHHLEYHMHNHVGSKPFKCAQCSYSCVNKSMLNSHMKSHSNVYQYRCADCAYVTKYCHSLKLHLRKYLHKPACVLNADGTPNPEPIIDVYGTRRGPKQKPRMSVQTSNEMNQGNDHFSANVQTNASIDLEKSDNNNVQSKPIVPSLQQPAAFPAFPSATNGTSDADMREGQNGVNQCQADATTYTYSQLFAAFNVNQFLFRENESLQTEMSSAASTATAANSDGRLPAEELIPQEQSPTTYYDVSDVNELPTASDYSIPGTRANTENDRLLGSSESVPLDLTKANGDCTQRAMTGSPKGTSRRRKGVAVKLEHRLVLEDTDEEATPNDAKSIESPTSSSFGSGANSDSKELEDKAEHWFGDGFVCYYCDICFRNEGMYTVHMGFHGYNEPYTCNMCGFQAADNMSFYLHINRRKGHA